jgi:outer membrane translocation and assembly module TamA
VLGVFNGETEWGVATGGTDPLFRHAYGADVHVGLDTDRVGYRAFYQYDRFRPTLLATLEDTNDAVASGGYFRTQELNLRASVIVMRSFRLAQSVSLDYRRRRETLVDDSDAGKKNLGALEGAWSLSSARQFPYSISPVEGFRLRLAYAREDPALGSDVSLGKGTGDVRFYTRVFGKNDALAVRAGGGATFGLSDFTQSFAIGGFPDASLLDLVRTNPVVLRGYPDNAFRGRSLAYGNLEYRVPLAHPQRGFRSYPVFLRHLHASAFFDAGQVWNDSFEWSNFKKSAGGALGADWIVFHRLPLTTLLGVGYGFDAGGETQVYFRTGLSF